MAWSGPGLGGLGGGYQNRHVPKLILNHMDCDLVSDGPEILTPAKDPADSLLIIMRYVLLL